MTDILAGTLASTLAGAVTGNDPAQARLEAWEIVLDRLELDVIRVEQAAGSGTGLSRPFDTWHVPDDYGPIPAVLRGRAEAVLVRQRAAVRQLAKALETTQAHRAYVSGASESPRSSGPVYLDLNA